MPLIHEIDYGTPESAATEQVTLDDRRPGSDRPRRHIDHARGDGSGHPHPEAVRHRHAGRIRLLPRVPVRDRGPRRHAGVLHHAGGARHEGLHHRRARAPHTPRRDGTVPDRPPARRLHLAGRRQQRIPGDGRTDRRAPGALRPERRQSPAFRDRRIQPLLPVRSGALHRVLTLRARVRGNPEHLRAHHRGPRLRLEGRRRRGRAVPDLGMRVVRRLRAGLPDRFAAREDRDRTRPARAFRDHHLRLLRRRLQLQGRDAGRHGGAHGAVEGRQGESRTFLREGPLRLGLRQSPGPRPRRR